MNQSHLQIALAAERQIVNGLDVHGSPYVTDGASRELRLALLKAIANFNLQVQREALWSHEDRERKAAGQ